MKGPQETKILEEILFFPLLPPQETGKNSSLHAHACNRAQCTRTGETCEERQASNATVRIPALVMNLCLGNNTVLLIPYLCAIVYDQMTNTSQSLMAINTGKYKGRPNRSVLTYVPMSTMVPLLNLSLLGAHISV